MPLKLPKNFVRRRSSGNVLESIENPPGQEPVVSSFRVLDRQSIENSPVDGTPKLKRMSAIRPRNGPYQKKSTDFVERSGKESNRGSEGTFNSGSIEREDNTSGSARYSCGSTTPSSIDYDSPTDENPEQARPSQARLEQGSMLASKKTQTSHGFSIKSAVRTFSAASGRRKSNSATASDNDHPELSSQPRERSVTQSSYASTATPPKLELGSDLGWMDAEFASGLGHLLNRMDEYSNTEIKGSGNHQTSQNISEQTLKSPTAYDTSFSPLQSRFNYSRAADSSPYSMASAGSHDPLMSPPVPRYGAHPHRSSSPGASSIQPADTEVGVVRNGASSRGFQSQWTPRTSSREGVKASDTSKAISGFAAYSRSTPTAQNMVNDINESRGASHWNTTPKASKFVPDDDESLFDNPLGLIQNLPQVDPVLENKSSRAMTQAEFEHYRSMVGKDDDEEDDTYEDEDDAEHLRQAAKQRRKQEANLAVYRQQMKKVTGEQPSDLPEATSRPFLDHRATQSTSNLLSSTSTGKDWFEINAAKAVEDEDDDVPLGVLQAHGFPSKTRPPTRMNSSRSQSNLRSVSQLSTYPPPQGSTRNDSAAGGGGAVPVFARKLPADLDPYIGAGLVNSTNRSSMALNAGQPNLPAGGLVGIIDAEQRDRLSRRGSPNTQGTYGPLSTPMPNQIPQTMSQIPRTMSMSNLQSPMQSGLPYGPPQLAMSASEQAQVQMSNSFNQLMQMQMAMMQQMMSMQNLTPQQHNMLQMQQQQMNVMQQAQSQPQYLAPSYDPRASMISDTASQGIGGHQRNVSIMSRPSLPQQSWGGSFGGGLVMPPPSVGYTPSIAPSERSTVGQPSRYRPVTSLGIPGMNQMQGQHSRTSTMSAQTIQYSLNQGGQEHQGVAGFHPPSSLALHRTSEPLLSTKVRAVSRPKYSNITGGKGSDDEDDEAGWQEMKKKKEARRGRWRRKQKEPEEAPEGAYYDYDGADSEI